jgi:hypothetical protein
MEEVRWRCEVLHQSVGILYRVRRGVEVAEIGGEAMGNGILIGVIIGVKEGVITADWRGDRVIEGGPGHWGLCMVLASVKEEEEVGGVPRGLKHWIGRRGG